MSRGFPLRQEKKLYDSVDVRLPPLRYTFGRACNGSSSTNRTPEKYLAMNVLEVDTHLSALYHRVKAYAYTSSLLLSYPHIPPPPLCGEPKGDLLWIRPFFSYL